MDELSSRIENHIASSTEPRRRKVVYPFIYIVTIAVCVVIADLFRFVWALNQIERRVHRGALRVSALFRVIVEYEDVLEVRLLSKCLAGVVTAIVPSDRPASTPRSLGIRALRVSVAEHDPRRWDRSGSWAVESRDAALARTSEFGRRFFQVVIAEFAEATGARFLRWSEQPDDVYAVFDLPGGGAGVQIDPDLEYIIVWGSDGRAEYGNWGADQVPPAVAHLRRLISRTRAGSGAAKAAE